MYTILYDTTIYNHIYIVWHVFTFTHIVHVYNCRYILYDTINLHQHVKWKCIFTLVDDILHDEFIYTHVYFVRHMFTFTYVQYEMFYAVFRYVQYEMFYVVFRYVQYEMFYVVFRYAHGCKHTRLSVTWLIGTRVYMLLA